MSDGLGFLTAVYRDGRVHIGGKSYPAGTFAVQLLNQYYKDDTAARIAVFRQSNWNVQEQLCAGYLNETDFIKAGKEILTILQTLPKRTCARLLNSSRNSFPVWTKPTVLMSSICCPLLRRYSGRIHFPCTRNILLSRNGETVASLSLPEE